MKKYRGRSGSCEIVRLSIAVVCAIFAWASPAFGQVPALSYAETDAIVDTPANFTVQSEANSGYIYNGQADASTSAPPSSPDMGFAEATASVGVGTANFNTFASTSNIAGDAEEAYATAYVYYYDTFTVNTGNPGASYTINASWLLDGTTNETATTKTTVNPEFGYQGVEYEALSRLTAQGTSVNQNATSIGQTVIGQVEEVTGNFGGTADISSPPMPTSIPLTFTVQSGVPFDFTLFLTLSSQVSVGSETTDGGDVAGSASSSADYSHTLDWGGISSVVDANGDPITDWTVTSASGFDYALPYAVPEPSTWGIMIGGLALLAFFRFRTRRA